MEPPVDRAPIAASDVEGQVLAQERREPTEPRIGEAHGPEGPAYRCTRPATADVASSIFVGRCRWKPARS